MNIDTDFETTALCKPQWYKTSTDRPGSFPQILT